MTYSFIKSSAENINRTLPSYSPDSSIRINEVQMIEDTIVYESTLLKNKDWEKWKIETEKTMIDSFKISHTFKILKEQHIFTFYNYRDRKKNLIFSIHITPDKYNSN